MSDIKNITKAKWIRSPKNSIDREIVFTKNIKLKKAVKSAFLEITALGNYLARINSKRVGNFILAPGWTSYKKRLQVDTNDVTDMLKGDNKIEIGVAPGWKGSWYFGTYWNTDDCVANRETAAIFALTVEYTDGKTEIITSSEDWLCEYGKNIYTSLYNGYTYDAAFVDEKPMNAVEFEKDNSILIDRQGEKITEQERLEAKKIIITPKGETVIDFGQNMSGYIEFKIKGKNGEKATIKHAEVLDANGNFYTDNLRTAKQEASFISDGEEHIHKAEYNFFGFRYISLEGFSDEIKKENFTAVVIHSDMKRTGYFECSDERVNRLFLNAVWGQKSNFVDVPTDCPQRDERLGWTGDAQAFVKTASYNYDVEKFFVKWLADLRADQTDWGSIPHVIPDVFSPSNDCSAAWADVAAIAPWQMYLTYANKEILKDSLESIKNILLLSKTRVLTEFGAEVHISAIG